MIADRASMANTFFGRLRGLLGRSELKPGEALVIEPCNSIHTFGMRFSIDALFLDGDSRVVALRRCLRPYRFTRIFGKARRVVELPVSTIEKSQTRVGDLIEIEDSSGRPSSAGPSAGKVCRGVSGDRDDIEHGLDQKEDWRP